MSTVIPPTATLNLTQVEGTWSESILGFVDTLDQQLGANQWSERQVAIVTIIFLGFIRVTAAHTFNVNWYSMIHAGITGYLSLLAVFLSVFAAVPLTGTPEPVRSLMCQGPLTTLHRLIPAITMGYGLFDVVDGFSHGLDFLLHGLATFSVMAYFCEVGKPEVITPMLLMEVSTPHLSLMRCTLLNDTAITINMALFCLTFFLFRMLLCPYLLWGITTSVWELRNDPTSQECLPWHFKFVVTGFGTFFNCLNTFWFYKIVKKVRRKYLGHEGLNSKNDLKDHQE
eukprot:Nitzschia sp. Nitz4//scaffold67_size101165//74513//75538//NITZ4_004536-RA/size101165-augustus-gene-0.15-mRNA-1//1//CDS//3329556495//8536//frame0